LNLLDTNIFIYARGGSHKYRGPCRAIIELLRNSQVDFNVDNEVLQELLYVYSYRKQREIGIKLVEDIQILLPAPIEITGQVVKKACELMRKYNNLVPRDAIHAAIVIVRGLEGIISTDKMFDSLEEVKRIDPINFAKNRVQE
jgi:predicted nucleic acid-binding protein